MTLNSGAFKPNGGRFYAHLFENPLVGITCDLFWCIEIDFEVIRYINENWDIGAHVEWLRFDKSALPVEHAVQASAISQPDGEASVYLAEHWPSDNWSLQIRPLTGQSKWNLDFDLQVDFAGLDDDPVPDLRVKGFISMDFNGFIVLPNNLSPKPTCEQQAAQLLAQYVDLSDGYTCTDEGWRYIFQLR